MKRSKIKMIDLYHMPLSAPCRAVRMAASTLGVELNLKFLDLSKGEHMTPEFLKVILNII